MQQAVHQFGGSAPSTPYTVDKHGNGPAWSNSLFEDNAEFGLGMFLAQAQIRSRLAEDAIALKETSVGKEVQDYLDTFHSTRGNDAPAKALISAIESTRGYFKFRGKSQFKTLIFRVC